MSEGPCRGTKSWTGPPAVHATYAVSDSPAIAMREWTFYDLEFASCDNLCCDTYSYFVPFDERFGQLCVPCNANVHDDEWPLSL